MQSSLANFMMKSTRAGKRASAVTNEPTPEPTSPTNPPPTNPSQLAPVVYTSAELLQGRREAWIEHEGERYRLRLTSQGKLYLTK
jgi:hemin uptake protein HemP